MQRMIEAIFAAGAAVIMLAWCGCAPSTEQPQGGTPPQVTAAQPNTVAQTGGDEEIMILCGSSFRLPMEKLVAMYQKQTGRSVAMSFGGCEDHLPKVKDKVAGDLFVAHTPYMQYTEDAGSLLEEVDVGFLAPALVVQKGNPQKVTKFEDLARPGLRVALPNPDFATCGAMVMKLLDTKYPKIKDAVLENVGNAMFRTHSETGSVIALGHRDAGIMWNGVAHEWRDKLEIVPLPYEYPDEVHVAVMGLSYTKKRPQVEAFLDFVRAHGTEVFTEFGYAK